MKKRQYWSIARLSLETRIALCQDQNTGKLAEVLFDLDRSCPWITLSGKLRKKFTSHPLFSFPRVRNSIRNFWFVSWPLFTPFSTKRECWLPKIIGVSFAIQDIERNRCSLACWTSATDFQFPSLQVLCAEVLEFILTFVQTHLLEREDKLMYGRTAEITFWWCFRCLWSATVREPP